MASATFRNNAIRLRQEAENLSRLAAEQENLASLADKPKNFFRVSDNHSHCRSGVNLAKHFVSKGIYNVCLNGEDDYLLLNKKTKISHRRYCSVKGITQGSVIFMADTVGNAVYRGVVTSNPIYENISGSEVSDPEKRSSIWMVPFDYHTPSERRKIEQRIKEGKEYYAGVHWHVEWSMLSPLTDIWKAILKPSVRLTAMEIDPTTAPQMI
jgi:hypothetical protein